jgi:putative hydrolases of HD superfamily
VQINRLTQQIQFIIEIDRLKQVMRQTLLIDGSRRENSAEHSWHLAVMAIALVDYAPQGVDIFHAIKMLLIHDLVEIDAGDTFCYDVQVDTPSDKSTGILGSMRSLNLDSLRRLSQR